MWGTVVALIAWRKESDKKIISFVAPELFRKVNGIMTISRFKKPALMFALPALLALPMLIAAPAQTTNQDQSFDAATTYKTKCVACHGPKADKRFDATLPEDQMVDTILKGKKAEKPPNMPAFGEKGIASDQAKALVAYMKSLKQ